MLALTLMFAYTLIFPYIEGNPDSEPPRRRHEQRRILPATLQQPTQSSPSVVGMPGAPRHSPTVQRRTLCHTTACRVELVTYANVQPLQELKFGIGDGKLRYYLYNWRMQRELQPEEVGLILL